MDETEEALNRAERTLNVYRTESFRIVPQPSWWRRRRVIFALIASAAFLVLAWYYDLSL